MLSSYQKFRLKRWTRTTLRSMVGHDSDFRSWFNNHIVQQWNKLKDIRRFMFGWLILVSLLFISIFTNNYLAEKSYLQKVPEKGGVYVEGVVGEINNMNPIFIDSSAAQAASKLIFNGILRYNDKAELENDLAKKVTIDKTGKIYTVELRNDVYWHDGKKLSADDVVYTFNMIADIESRSPLYSNWKDIKVSKVSKQKVMFELPNAFPAFQHSLTTGIIPKHLLGELSAAELRLSSFNQQPTGTGPFKFSALSQEGGSAQFEANPNYFRGEPKLDRFVIEAFKDQESLESAFTDGELTAAAGISYKKYYDVEKDNKNTITNYQLFSSVLAFLNTSRAPLDDVKVRTALLRATSSSEIIEKAKLPLLKADGPLLDGQFGYVKSGNKQNIAEANKLLDESGWKLAQDGYRYKNNQLLELNIVTQNSNEFPEVTKQLQQQWKKVGVKCSISEQNADDLQADKILNHDYQVLLFGLENGVDPDQFAFWHSSQKGKKDLNLSEISDKKLDEALEAGRTRTDPALRSQKYKTFQKIWFQLAPAVPLYRSSFIYVQTDEVIGPKDAKISSPTDRFNNVEDWAVKTKLGIEK